ncbi:MAG: hypothetical protein ACI9F2_000288 [Lysobacterales bacterium]|jgi:uncharacterized protein YacL
MTLTYIRVLFIIASGVVGYYVGTLLNEAVLGVQLGCLLGLVVIFIEQRMQRVSMSGLSSVVFGLLLGIFMAKLIIGILQLLPIDLFTLSVSEVIVTLVFSYIGATMALRGKDEFNVIIPYVRFKRQAVNENVILIDTSAIIDGRIQNIYHSRFLSGRLIVTRSVLQELQKLADSEESIKQDRGRRGLELITEMLKDSDIEIRVHEDDFDGRDNVDDRLVTLAKIMDASICTTDHNLGRVAAVQGIDILNVHELVDAVRPALHSGDQLDVMLVKRGREKDQAVGYLDDGTMVVVKGSIDNIGKNVKVEVTSILQTQSGRMIFAK